MTWEDIRDAWSNGWRRLQAQAVEVYGSAIRANPEAFREVVAGFVNELAYTRATLDHMRSVRPSPVRTAEDVAAVQMYRDFERRYHDLAAGLFADAEAAPAVGLAPAVVGLVVAGVLITVGAVAWAIVAYEYAVNLREQTALADRELTARIEASRDGRALPPSTLPPPPPAPGEQAANAGWVVLGGLALVAGAALLPTLWRT